MRIISIFFGFIFYLMGAIAVISESADPYTKNISIMITIIGCILLYIGFKRKKRAYQKKGSGLSVVRTVTLFWLGSCTWMIKEAEEYSSGKSIFQLGTPAVIIWIIGIAMLFFPVIKVIWMIYEFLYYKSAKFSVVKNRIQSYINNCNELNEHIEELKKSSILVNRIDYGIANYQDSSNWRYKRKYLNNQKYAPNIHILYKR